jgi:hypothetical protein
MDSFYNVFINWYCIMKRIFSGVIIAVFLTVTGLLIYGMSGKVRQNRLSAQRIKRLPAFSFTTVTGETFNSSDIRTGPLLVVRFHPECEHCQYEISEIMKSDLPVSGTKIILVSSAEKPTVINFLSQFDLSGYPNITTLIDTSYAFGEIFGNNMVPGNYVYNSRLELVKAMSGEVKIGTILKYLKSGEYKN